MSFKILFYLFIFFFGFQIFGIFFSLFLEFALFKKKFPTRIAKLGKFKIKKHVGCWGGGWWGL